MTQDEEREWKRIPHRPEAIAIVQAWERAKGEMRAAVAAIGTMPPVYDPRGPGHDPPSRYVTTRDEIETFIKAMDDQERFNL